MKKHDFKNKERIYQRNNGKKKIILCVVILIVFINQVAFASFKPADVLKKYERDLEYGEKEVPFKEQGVNLNMSYIEPISLDSLDLHITELSKSHGYFTLRILDYKSFDNFVKISEEAKKDILMKFVEDNYLNVLGTNPVHVLIIYEDEIIYDFKLDEKGTIDTYATIETFEVPIKRLTIDKNKKGIDLPKNNKESFLFEGIDYSKKDYITVILDGKEIQFDVNPQAIDGRTLVPMRSVFEAMGLDVSWDGVERIALGRKEGFSIEFKIDSKNIKINSVDHIIDVPAKAKDGRTLIPLRVLSESMNYNVVWVGDSNLILLSQDEILEWRYEGYEGIYPHKEYERKYINGEKTGETRYNGKKSLPIRIETEVEESHQNLRTTIYATNISNKEYLGVDVIHFIYNNKTKKIEEEKKHEIGLPPKGESSYLGSYKRYVGSYEILNKEGKLYLGSVIEKCEGYEGIEFINEKLQDEKNKITSSGAIDSAVKEYNRYKKKIDKELKEEMALNKGGPLVITDKTVTYNSIGIPEAHVSFKNVSTKTIDAFEITIKCYDSYDRLVRKQISNEGAFYGISQNRNISSGDMQGATWTLHLFDNTTKFDATITSVHFTDGTVWKK